MRIERCEKFNNKFRNKNTRVFNNLENNINKKSIVNLIMLMYKMFNEKEDKSWKTFPKNQDMHKN